MKNVKNEIRRCKVSLLGDGLKMVVSIKNSIYKCVALLRNDSVNLDGRIYRDLCVAR